MENEHDPKIDFKAIVNLLHGEFDKLDINEIKNCVSDSISKYLSCASTVRNPKGWVYKVSYRLLLKAVEKLERIGSMPNLEIDFIQETHGYKMTNPDNTNDEPDFQLKKYIIEQVGVTNAQIIFMHTDEYTFGEIGERLNISKDAARQRFKRAKDKLTKKLPPNKKTKIF